KRVNLLIGYPNVGKSNILEAIALLSNYQSSHKFMDGYIRYDDLDNLFYENDSTSGLAVASNIGTAFLRPESTISNKFKYSLLLNETNLETLIRYDKDSTKEGMFIKRIKRTIDVFEYESNSSIINIDGTSIIKDSEDEFDFIIPEVEKRVKKKYDFKPI